MISPIHHASVVYLANSIGRRIESGKGAWALRGADLNKIREYNIPYFDYGEQIREIRGLTGTNIFLKREVFEKVGFFDTRLGAIGVLFVRHRFF